MKALMMNEEMLATYSQIADDNLAHAVSTSWGVSENEAMSSLLGSENKIFKQMAAQGQTIYAASGDSGAYADGKNLGVDDPGSQPFVVGVGGTLLKTHSDGTYKSETTWNQNDNPTDGGGGGGISSVSAPTCMAKGRNERRNQGLDCHAQYA